MRIILFLLFCFLASVCRAQNMGDAYGIDTARHPYSFTCPDSLDRHDAMYFQVKGKYPRASFTIAKEAQAALVATGQHFTDDGFVTFQVLLDCEAKPEKIWVWTIDNNYKSTLLAKDLVLALYHYFQSLQGWRKANYNGAPLSYYTYLTFKIENGHVAQVAP